MIVANMATYPARADQLRRSLPTLARQVDRLHLVLNEYDSVPGWIDDLDNVVRHLPEEDLKDVGKFLVCDQEAELIFLVDDDLSYPDDYVARSVERMAPFAQKPVVGGYHASRYLPPRTEDAPRLYQRRVRHFRNPLDEAMPVDQIATNSAILRPRDMPPLDYMMGSQCFVDVRLAKWSYEQGIAHMTLPREGFWITQLDVEQSIYQSFTATYPDHVDTEILSYALKRPEIAKPYLSARRN